LHLVRCVGKHIIDRLCKGGKDKTGKTENQVDLAVGEKGKLAVGENDGECKSDS
jgi:hypothetical protein